MTALRGALEAVDRIVNRGGDADDVLREAVALLFERLEDVDFVGILFVQGDELVLGPFAGLRPERGTRLPLGAGAPPDPAGRFGWVRSQISVPITFADALVARLDAESPQPEAFNGETETFLERVALLLSPYCLVGWDTDAR